MGRAAQLGDPWAKYALHQPLDPAHKATLVAAADFGVNNMAIAAEILKQDDPEAAREWLGKAASAGDVASMEQLGDALADSDPSVAMQWWERAAGLDTTAEYNLGVKVAKADPGRARQLWAKAAESTRTGIPHTRARFSASLGRASTSAGPAGPSMATTA
jgi:TPR repeat protein